jgi:lysophospholipase L1-like esterase
MGGKNARARARRKDLRYPESGPVFALTIAALLAAAPTPAPPSFHLRSGDRVVFFGDSITDQRLYTSFVETFVLTRFPHLDVRFVHSGWGGDRVTGGLGGRVDVRLQRDVIAHRPTVVTVMLGMNDGRYRPFEQPIYDRFVDGYDRLIRSLRSELPQARLTVIQPSPYDDVTRPPFEGGSYNQVLVRFGAFIRKVAEREHLTLADFNGDLVTVLQKLNGDDPKVALKVLPDRVHPTEAGHLVMTQSLLKAWGAPALVTSVEMEGARGNLVAATNTQVSDISRVEGVLRWSQLDRALPMPIDLADPVIQMTTAASGFVARLDQQPLKVSGLGAGFYALRIDDQQVGVFRAADLARGINLAVLPTPMLRQASDVHDLTLKHNDLHFTRWRLVQTRLEKDGAAQTGGALDALDKLEQEIIDRQHVTARPRLRRYELAPVSPVAANIPVGFTPVFGTGELRQVLLDGNRRKNLEVFLEIDGESETAAALVLRMTDRWRGYRVSLDGREGGTFGRIDPPGGKDTKAAANPFTWPEHWKKADWNAVRVRMQGDRAKVTIWLNGWKVIEWTDSAGPPPEDDNDGWGLTAIELPGERMPHFRNVSVKQLPHTGDE